MGCCMRVRSLGIESDLIFHRRNGEVVECGNYLLVRTPTQPNYFWGNYLIYARAPRGEQLSDWEITFGREFSGQPLSTHRSFTWDANGMADPLAPGEIEAFRELGYEYDISVVLTASRVSEPPHPNSQVGYRRLLREDDWQQMLDLQLQNRSEQFAEAPYREFLRARVAAWRELVNAGAGVWLGAFDADRLVADAGLFWEGKLGRFQNVETRESYRRRGICGTLVHRLSEYGFAEAGLTHLVMLADEDYHAARIYESLGFERTERVGSLCSYDRDHWNSRA
jgi:ribosomal protein S18 acetylase RimI-like enzyme